MKTKLEKRFSYSNCFVSKIPMNDSFKSLLYVCVKFWWQTRLDNEYERTNMRSKLCRAQINPPNRLKNILPLKTKESLYHLFILPNFYHCSHVWHHCRKRNTTKIEKVNERSLRYVYNDKHTSYQHRLERIRLPSWNLEEFKTCYWQYIIISGTKHHGQLGILLIYAHLSTISGAKNMFYLYLK